MTFGSRLKQALIQKGWNQTKLAKELGIQQSFVSRVTRDDAHFNFEHTVKVAQLLGVSLDWLAFGGGLRSSPPPYYESKVRQSLEYLLGLLEEDDLKAVSSFTERLVQQRQREAAAYPEEAAEKGKSYKP